MGSLDEAKRLKIAKLRVEELKKSGISDLSGSGRVSANSKRPRVSYATPQTQKVVDYVPMTQNKSRGSYGDKLIL